MRTIKELETEINERRGDICSKPMLKQLKDVLELIDEYERQIKKEIVSIQTCNLRKLYTEEDKKRDLIIMRSRVVVLEDLKSKIEGKNKCKAK